METNSLKKILVVDDDKLIISILTRHLSPKYYVSSAYDGFQALQMLKKERFDLIITDIHMPNLNGIELTMLARANHPDVHIIGTSSLLDSSIIMSLLNLGVKHYFKKPYKVEDLDKVLDGKIWTESMPACKTGGVTIPVSEPSSDSIKTKEDIPDLSCDKKAKVISQDIYKAIVSRGYEKNENARKFLPVCIKSCLELLKDNEKIVNNFYKIKQFDDIVYSHSLISGVIASILAAMRHTPAQDLRHIIICGFLHDIGMTKVSAELIKKPCKLTDDEYENIKVHTIEGYQLFADDGFPDEVSKAVQAHHERLDGSGYPRGCKEMFINEYAQITAVADIYSALTQDRPHRKAYSHDETLNIMKNEYSGKISMDMVDLLHELK